MSNGESSGYHNGLPRVGAHRGRGLTLPVSLHGRTVVVMLAMGLVFGFAGASAGQNLHVSVLTVEVTTLNFSGPTTLMWASVAGNGVTYDVLRGTSLPVGSNPSGESCVASYYSGTSIMVTESPAAGSTH